MTNPADSEVPKRASDGMKVLLSWLGFFGFVAVVVALTLVYGTNDAPQNKAAENPATTSGSAVR